jgi:S-adenosylmethionine:tRNA ribosyltransferase-isomerase
MTIQFSKHLCATLSQKDPDIPRLWKLHFSKSGSDLLDVLYQIGHPIHYEYISAPWSLDDYQTVYATEPGSAELPSAGRAFTWKILLDLRRHGVQIAFITLHAGLSSFMDDALDSQHPHTEEEYEIGTRAAEQIEATRQNGGRIIAIGTTVVKALESAQEASGKITNSHDYTSLHISEDTKLQVVDGLLTGFHEPYASHLDLLSAFLPPAVIQKAYNEAIRYSYLWHEFGDLNLIV